MCRCFVLSDAVLQGERLGQGCGQLGIDPVVELEQIRLPGAVRADAVCPAVVGIGTEIFAVIGEVLRTSVGVGDAVRFAEHQQTGKCQSLDLFSAIDPVTLQFHQEMFVVQQQPRMIGAFGCDQPAVLLKSCLVNILLDGKFGQNFVIAGMFCDISVGEHALYFACIAPKVSFVIPLECILGVVMQIYGYLVAGSPWYIEYQDIAPVVFAILHVFLLQDVCAAMSLVVYVVPKLFFVFARLLQCDAVKCEFPVLLFDAQYDDSTLRIGESGVGFPQAARKPSPGGFELHLGRFTVGHQRFDFFYKIVVVEQC